MKIFKTTPLAALAIVLFTLAFTNAPQEISNVGDYDYMKQRLDNAKAFTVEVFEAMPTSDYTFKPSEDVRTFAGQAYHVAYSLEWYNNALKGSPVPWAPGDENSMNKEELITYVKAQFDAISETIYAAKQDDRFTMGVISVLDHNSHHRGQMVSYLRMKGITPPSYR